ncbi:metal ABC transporter permease [Bacillus licheniformis]|nr:metal ABC transporter permease [Bacillus licheniformis]
MLTALGIGYVSQNSRIKTIRPSASYLRPFRRRNHIDHACQSSSDLYHILFGNVLAVRSSDMWITLVIGVIILTAVFYLQRAAHHLFRPDDGGCLRLAEPADPLLLMTLLTMVTVASLQTVGIILVVAMLITPAATAYLLTDRLWVMIYLSAFLGALSAVIGLGLSYTYNLSSGAAIVLVATICSDFPLRFHRNKACFGEL